MPQIFVFSLMVGIGGFFGSLARFSLSHIAQRLTITWPAGTFAANILGCFFIGIIMALAARGDSLSPEMKILLATGFCGGFTTLSSFVYETTEMIRSSEYVHAVFYVSGTFFISIVSFYLGTIFLKILIK